MVMAVKQGNGTLIDQFAKSSGTLTVIGGAGLVIGSFVSGGTATPNFSRFARKRQRLVRSRPLSRSLSATR